MQITIDHRLEQDSSYIMDLELSQVRLSHNAAFPWIILIPRQDKLAEIIDLSDDHQILLMKEIVLASKVMQHIFKPTKLNVANLGNIVPQLHIHIIARYDTDMAWPDPIWNSGKKQLYEDHIKAQIINQIKESLLS